MTRRAKRTRLYLNKLISRSEALAHLAHIEINQATLPAANVLPPLSEAEDADQQPDDNNFDCYDHGTAPSTSNSDSSDESSLE
jgi:hypothetical protein